MHIPDFLTFIDLRALACHVVAGIVTYGIGCAFRRWEPAISKVLGIERPRKPKK